MKKILLGLALAVLFAGVVGFATERSRGLGFEVPGIDHKENVYDPRVGEIVYDSSDKTFYGRDHTPSWVALSAPSGGFVPTGTVLPFAGATAPTGYLLAYGQAVSRTAYAALFAVIGTTYGTGDGSTTFNLPDLRGRVPVGEDDLGGAAANRMTTALSGVDGATLGASGGAQSHILSTSEIPSHRHNISVNGFTATSLTASSGSGFGSIAYGGTSTNNPDIAGNHALANDAAGAVRYTGGGNPHNNTQPSIILSYIIKI